MGLQQQRYRSNGSQVGVSLAAVVAGKQPQRNRGSVGGRATSSSSGGGNGEQQAPVDFESGSLQPVIGGFEPALQVLPRGVALVRNLRPSIVSCHCSGTPLS